MSWRLDAMPMTCGGCGGPLATRMLGAERKDPYEVCEAQTCWPELPKSWKREVAILGFARDYGARRRLRRAG